MNAYRFKIWQYIPRFSFLAWITMLLIVGVRYLISISNSSVANNAMLWEALVPLVFCCIPVFLFTRKKVRLVGYEYSGFDWRQVIHLIAGTSVFCMNYFTQQYVSRQLGGFTSVDQVIHIPENESSRYYKIQHFDIDRESTIASQDIIKSDGGRHSDSRLLLYYYCIAPFKGSAGNKGDVPKYWLARTYHKEEEINRQDDNWNNAVAGNYFRECDKDFRNIDLKAIDYFELITDEENLSVLRKGIDETYQNASANHVKILKPVMEPETLLERRLLLRAIASYAAGTLVLMFILLFPPIPREVYEGK